MLFNVVNNLCRHIRPLVSNHFFKTGDKGKKTPQRGITDVFYVVE